MIGEIIEDDIGIFIAAHEWVGKTKYMVSAVSEWVGDSVSTINIVAFQFQPYPSYIEWKSIHVCGGTLHEWWMCDIGDVGYKKLIITFAMEMNANNDDQW